MAETVLKGFLIFLFLKVVEGGEWCTEYDSDDWFGHSDTIWCSSGCCGTNYDRYCCYNESVSAIVGIVIGCLAGVALIVGTIIAICCCCRKQRGRLGQVVGGQQTTTTTTTSTAVVGGAYPMAPYPSAPAYGQPAMGYTNAAYPQAPMQFNAGYPQMPQTSVDQKWQQPPPSYDQINPS